MGGASYWSGFSAEVPGVQPSDHDRTQTGGKKCEGNKGKALKKNRRYAIIISRDIFLAGVVYPAIPCFSRLGGARDHKEVKRHEQIRISPCC